MPPQLLSFGDTCTDRFCVCLCVLMCVCVHVHAMGICMCMCLCICACAHACVFLHTQTLSRMHALAHACARARAHTHTHTHIHTHTHTHTHTPSEPPSQLPTSSSLCVWTQLRATLRTPSYTRLLRTGDSQSMNPPKRKESGFSGHHGRAVRNTRGVIADKKRNITYPWPRVFIIGWGNREREEERGGRGGEREEWERGRGNERQRESAREKEVG